MNTKIIESLSAMDFKIDEHEKVNLGRYEMLDNFKESITNQDSIIDETENKVEELRKLIDDF